VAARFTRIEEPTTLEVEDGFADDSGEPNREMAITRMVVSLEGSADGTRMTLVSLFDSVEGLEQMVGMGMVEGLTAAAGQIDALLADAS
jgi:uncharacterized protein YndB with AHSA1/START domain